MRLPSRELKAEKISEALFATAFNRMKTGEVARFIKSSEPYAAACLTVLERIGIVDRTPDGYQAIPLVAEDLRKMRKEDRYLIIARYAMRYKPFVEFVSIIHKGYTASDAATKVNVIYKLEAKDEFVEKLLLELGIYGKVLRELDGKFGLNVVVEELPRDYLDRLKEATLGEVQARLFVREHIGQEAYQFLGDEQVDDIVHALLEFRRDPKDAVVASGRAIEDFLRTTAVRKGRQDYSTRNGIIEISNQMRGEDPPLILPGHVARTHFIGMLRNPGGGHGKDKETLERWNVTPEAALESILAALSCVRSIYSYTFDGQQVL